VTEAQHRTGRIALGVDWLCQPESIVGGSGNPGRVSTPECARDLRQAELGHWAMQSLTISAQIASPTWLPPD